MSKILIIDDDADIRAMLRTLLESRGHDVIEAPAGYVGVLQFEATRPDLVITDIVMPDQEGISTIVEIRKKKPDAKIIAMSGGGSMPSAGSSAVEYLEIARKLRADLVFLKPLEVDALLQAVRTLLS